jgi:hypothetical protein
MKPRALILAFALPVVFAALVLGSGLMNRRGGRGPTVLSERELRPGPRSDDQSVAEVRLTWSEPARSPGGWLTREQLAAVGFDVSLDAFDSQAEDSYRRQAPRRAFVVFELAGPSWYELLEERQRGDPAVAPESAGQPMAGASRLVPVDVARDGATLAARYPDPRTHLIVPAVVGIGRIARAGGPPGLGGMLISVDPPRIQVPVGLSAGVPFVSPRDNTSTTPFSMSLMYGSRWEPWIVSVDPGSR